MSPAFWRSAIGFALGLVLRLWARSWRVALVARRALPERGVFAFLHGNQMGLLGVRPRGLGVLVSHSRDGQLQTGVLAAFGIHASRGSSSRGGSGGLRALVRWLERGRPIGFAVDGPKGPHGVCKPGVVAAARLGRAPVVVVAAASSNTLVLRRTWDRFEVPLPFARVVVVAEPIGEEASALDAVAVEQALSAALGEARSLVAAPRRVWQSRPMRDGAISE